MAWGSTVCSLWWSDHLKGYGCTEMSTNKPGCLDCYTKNLQFGSPKKLVFESRRSISTAFCCRLTKTTSINPPIVLVGENAVLPLWSFQCGLCLSCCSSVWCPWWNWWRTSWQCQHTTLERCPVCWCWGSCPHTSWYPLAWARRLSHPTENGTEFPLLLY